MGPVWARFYQMWRWPQCPLAILKAALGTGLLGLAGQHTQHVQGIKVLGVEGQHLLVANLGQRHLPLLVVSQGLHQQTLCLGGMPDKSFAFGADGWAGFKFGLHVQILGS